MNDARKIPDEAMSYIRKMAVKAIRELGYSPELISKIFDIHRSSIYDWLKLFDRGGYDALDTRKAPGMTAIVTPEMESWLKEIIISSTPEQYGYDTELWTSAILADLLNKQFDINIQPATVNQHLKKIGISYQKPSYVASEQNPNEVKKFINEEFPKIQKLAEEINADIFFEDEAGIDLRQHSGRTWGAIGKTPKISATDKRGSYNILCVVSSDGTLRFSIKDGTINEDVFIGFLQQLLRGRDRPIILIMDNVPFHKSKKVRNFVESHSDKIRIFFLPAYSPALNPTEQAWEEVKDNKIGRQPKKDKLDLKRRIRSALSSLQKRIDRVTSFFELPDTEYAGA